MAFYKKPFSGDIYEESSTIFSIKTILHCYDDDTDKRCFNSLSYLNVIYMVDICVRIVFAKLIVFLRFFVVFPHTSQDDVD